MSLIHVMAAVICNPSGQVLIARRPNDAHQGGLWEFPGGKLEEGEQRFDGLKRELYEELGIQVLKARPLLDVRYDYPDKSVRLDVWKVTDFAGEAHGAEGQPVRWVEPAELNNYDFPKANVPIVTAARLPDSYLVTPDLMNHADLLKGLARVQSAGIRMIQLRQTQLGAANYQKLATTIVGGSSAGVVWLLKGDSPPTQPGVGWHLTATQLRRFAQGGWPNPERREVWPVAASCHNAEELEMAEQLGVDFVTLSPVLPTLSHPEAPCLGWERVQAMIQRINLPVYVMGGVGKEHLPQAFEIGAQGVAGIRGLWLADRNSGFPPSRE